MFVMNFASELKPKLNKRTVVFMLVSLITFFSYVTFMNFAWVDELPLESESEFGLSGFTEVQSNNSVPLAIEKDCGKLNSAYELLGVVFDKKSVLALVEVLETGAMLVIEKREERELRLNSAELTKAEFQLEECQFTLFLN